MTDEIDDPAADLEAVETVEELAAALRWLQRRHARSQRDATLTLRELSVRTGYARGVLGDYLSGKRLAPTDKFDVLCVVFGAGPRERRMLANARDRVEENIRRVRRTSRYRSEEAATEGAGEYTIARPRTLPRGASVFVGRTAEIDRITELVSGGTHGNGYPVCAIEGMPGVGKTTFALHVGRLLAERFPDGQLFLDLHAHTAGQLPTEPIDALASLLTVIGVAMQNLPTGVDDRSALWRAKTAGKALLVILDNAASSSHIQPLLPGGDDCLVLVTSRRRLATLDATPLSLSPLSHSQCLEMFMRLTSLNSIERHAAAEVVQLCGHLPLAIALLAGVLRSRPMWGVADLVAEITTIAGHRLGGLHAEAGAVSTAFDLSYQHLPADRKGFFRQLSRHPGHDFDVATAAAMGGIHAQSAFQELQALYDDHLIEERERGRYRMHDLIRDYAQTLSSYDPIEERDQVIGRLFDHYESLVAAADARLTRHTRPAITSTGTRSPAPTFSGWADALAWTQSERANIVACIAHAAAIGQLASAIRLTAGLASLFRFDGPWDQAIELHSAAAMTARQLHDSIAEANALYDLGQVRRLQGDYPAAKANLQEALDIYRAEGSTLGEANTIKELADVTYLTGDFASSMDLHQQALHLFQHIGDKLGEASSHNYLAAVRQAIADYEGAAAALEAALAAYQSLNDLVGQAGVLYYVGIVQRMTADYPNAISTQTQALHLYCDLAHRNGEANVLNELGVAYQQSGHYDASLQAHRRALQIYRDLGDRNGEANALNYMGITMRLAGDYAMAEQVHRQALEMYVHMGRRLGQALMHNSLGVTWRLTGDHASAQKAQTAALGLFDELGMSIGKALVLNEIGLLQLAAENYTESASAINEALEIYRERGYRSGAVEALNSIGALLRHTADPQLALDRHREALCLAGEIHSPLEEARALEGIGRCLMAMGDHVTGWAEMRSALIIYQRIGAAEANSLQAYAEPHDSHAPCPMPSDAVRGSDADSRRHAD